TSRLIRLPVSGCWLSCPTALPWPCSSSRHRLATCPWRDTAAPSVQLHYRAFIPTTDCSVPVPRIGTLALAGISRLTVGAKVPRFQKKTLIGIPPPPRRVPPGAGPQAPPQTHPGAHSLPPG